MSKHLNEIKVAAERAASLTRQLLAFSRQQVLYPRILDLNAVVNNLMQMLLRLIGEDISLSFKSGTVGSIRADLGQIEQVLMNLVVNARDAMSHGGTISIETSILTSPCHRDVMSFSASATTAVAWMKRPWRKSSNLSSPPRTRGKAPALDSRRSTAL